VPTDHRAEPALLLYRQIPTLRRSIPATTKRSVIGLQVKSVEAIGPTALTLIERGEIHTGISLFQSVQADDRHHDVNCAAG
jgi:hypothetical protein